MRYVMRMFGDALASLRLAIPIALLSDSVAFAPTLAALVAPPGRSLSLGGPDLGARLTELLAPIATAARQRLNAALGAEKEPPAL